MDVGSRRGFQALELIGQDRTTVRTPLGLGFTISGFDFEVRW